jgi:hypothetical protein
LKLKQGVLFLILSSCLNWLTTAPALAQARGDAFTIRVASFSPIAALIAGILILIVPRLLNYIVAIYLILIGLLGLFGRP